MATRWASSSASSTLAATNAVQPKDIGQRQTEILFVFDD
jgi:hypothetical protein